MSDLRKKDNEDASDLEESNEVKTVGLTSPDNAVYASDIELIDKSGSEENSSTEDKCDEVDILNECTEGEIFIFNDVLLILNRLKFDSNFEVKLIAKLIMNGIMSRDCNVRPREFFKKEAKKCTLNDKAIEMRIRRAFASALANGEFRVIFRKIFNMDANNQLTFVNFVSSFVLSYIITYKDNGKTFSSIAKDFFS